MRKLFTIPALISLSTMVACSSLSKQAEKPFQLRPMQEKTLANGLRILYITDTSLPRVSYNLMIQSGSAQDPQGEEGLSSLTLSLLEQGTTKKNALQVADEFAQLGSSFSETASNDFVMMSTAGLSETKDKLLSLFSEVILTPAFSQAEVERKRSQVIAELMQLPDNPTEYASLLYDRELFGKHPYSHPVIGSIPAVKSITRAQIIKNYYSVYRPNNAMLAVTGNFDDSFKEQVEKVFSKWQSGPVEAQKNAAPEDLAKMDFKLYSKAGLQQTQIRIGQLGIGRNDPDFMKLRLANIVLGGAFASRLNQKVRDDLGLTYGISSHFDSKKGTGSFEINTFSRNEKAGEAIKNTLAVVREFQDKGITQKELNAAKALLVGQFPAAIETVDRYAFNLLNLRLYGVPDTYLSNFIQNVNSIELKEVNAAIHKHLHADRLKVVVFADGKTVEKDLSEIGKFEVKPVQ